MTLSIEGRDLQIGNLNRPLFPNSAFTQAHVINYYIRVAKYILPHLRDRPLTLKLYPDGVGGPVRYVKNAPVYTPEWVKLGGVQRRSREGKICYVLVNDLPTLAWAANLHNIEMHTVLARMPHIEQPTAMVFDLDPGERATILDCALVALRLKDALENLSLESLVKSSGSKGLHLYVPLNSKVSYDQTQRLAKLLAEYLERTHPELVVAEMAKAARGGKVFVDYSQNADYKSTVCVYSLRAKPDEPRVSMPVAWGELAGAVEKKDAAAFRISPDRAIQLCEALGDRFAPVLKLKQKLPRDPGSAVDSLRRRGAGAGAGIPKAGDRLVAYHRKRNFSVTAEPAGKASADEKGAPLPLFVVQKHAASHLHYDFRLEMEGVLRSWAVPKGPPLTRGERRLAMHVEDHPLEYARFEGTIPAGQYGGGTVMVWDIGTYEVQDGSPAAAFYKGTLHLRLKGTKLRGEWALVRGRDSERGKGPPWFLIKIGSDSRPISRRRDDQSALTRRTMSQIARQNTAQWSSQR